MELGPEGSWFRIEGESERVELIRRASLRRIFLALVEHFETSQFGSVPREHLIERGWPGE